MRRSAVSVPSNIAEGQDRLSDRNFVLFLGHARGSLYELETQTELATQFGFVETSTGLELVAQINEEARRLNVFLAKLQRPDTIATVPATSADHVERTVTTDPFFADRTSTDRFSADRLWRTAVPPTGL
jgi:four helix bundle protein